MRILFIFSFITASSIGLAQEEMTVTHYQRNWETDTLHKPCEIWNSKDMMIVIPDSIVTHGTITVKKMKWQGKGRFTYKLTIKDYVVTKVVVTGKGKKRREMLRDYHMIIFNNTESMDCNPNSVFDTSGRLAGISMTIKP